MGYFGPAFSITLLYCPWERKYKIPTPSAFNYTLENTYPISLMDEIHIKIRLMLILSFALILNVMMTKKTKP